MATFNSEEAAKKLADRALDEILYKGKSIREWVKIIASEDCISRKEALKIFGDDIHPLDYHTNGYVNAIKNLPPVINRTAAPRSGSMTIPKDEVVYGYISKQFPTTNVFFDSYETALNSAIHYQPKHRPFYMIKATRHFEFCGIVGEGDNQYEVEVLTRGNCMMCGKELTEGLFFCKECEDSGTGVNKNENTK